jgi:hypothetical protein
LILLATAAEAVPNKPITAVPPSVTGSVAPGHAPDGIQATQVLYDQTDSKGTVATSSQNFSPTAWDGFDDRLADDFVVPAGSTWSITKVSVNGIYTNPVNGSTLGPPDSIDVVFYPDSGGLPGTPLANRPGLSPSSGLATGNFVIPLGSAVSLGSGTYWVSVRTNQNYETHGQWKWLDRTVQSNSPAAWVNPRDQFGTGCSTWMPRASACHLDSSEPDQVFQLAGSEVAAPTITSLTPTQGPVGTTVTITGMSFTGATDVRFGGVSGALAHFTVDSDTQITATVPKGATTGYIVVFINRVRGSSRPDIFSVTP